MKLKYKITKTTDQSTTALIKRILTLIDEKKYGVVDVTKNSVSFDDKLRLFVGNWEDIRRVNSGRFEIIEIDYIRVVVFEYLPIAVFEYIWVGILVAAIEIVSFRYNAYAASFFVLPFLGQLIFKHYNLQRKANEMLDTVVA